ncbi:MAG: hypothetical protein V4504_00960 [Patescibacteria group bacterium]
MYKIFLKSCFVFVILCLLLGPVFSFADTTIDLSTKGEGISVPCPKAGCGWDDLMDLINKVLNFILFKLAIPIAAIMFCYAGFLMITAGDESAGARNKAKSIAGGVVMGLIFAAAAWLIVHLVLDTLGYDGSWIGF